MIRGPFQAEAPGQAHPKKALTILIVEDHPLVRDGLRLFLAGSGFTICAEAETCAQALEALAGTQPDLILLDLSLHEENGLDLLRTLPEGAPPVLVYSMHEDWLHVRLSLLAGARGYATKREISEVLLEALAATLEAPPYLSPRALQALEMEAGDDLNLDGLKACSHQEMEILRLLGRGQGVGEVADALEISRKTVESYCSRIMVKLNLLGMKELRTLAMRAFGR